MHVFANCKTPTWFVATNIGDLCKEWLNLLNKVKVCEKRSTTAPALENTTTVL